MRRKVWYIIVLGVIHSVCCHGQDDAYLRKLTEDLNQIRKVKASTDMRNNIVMAWSALDSPKITMMDEIERDKEHEFYGNGANKFKLNQMITYVYSRQNTGMVSKGDYFNSTENGVFYSAIEKNIKKGETATYTLTGHIGVQEFVFLSFSPKTKFKAKVNSSQAEVKGDGVQVFKSERVRKQDVIVFTITNESASNESFVILNHNPQK